MWIPYYNAPGYEKGSEYFDVTIMQPNYAFNSWTVDGTVGPERMVNTWNTCKENGFGIEVEIRSNSAHDVRCSSGTCPTVRLTGWGISSMLTAIT